MQIGEEIFFANLAGKGSAGGSVTQLCDGLRNRLPGLKLMRDFLAVTSAMGVIHREQLFSPARSLESGWKACLPSVIGAAELRPPSMSALGCLRQLTRPAFSMGFSRNSFSQPEGSSAITDNC